MQPIFRTAVAAAITYCTMCSASSASPFAERVVEYIPGTVRADYQNASAALGKTASTTGGPVVSPFNAPFQPSDLTGIGPGGELILQLGQTAQTGNGYTLGVHAGVNLLNVGGSAGQASNPATTFSFRRADLSVSFDGSSWTTLQNDVVFNIPTNWYSAGVTAPANQTTPGTIEADFTKPFAGSLSDFNGLTYSQMLTVLDGSAGGTWFDLTNVNLPGVNYVKFDVGTDDTQMYVDTVVAVPEPVILLLLPAALLLRRP